MLKINEIFYSIQGESAYAGLPCAMVRLTGCNLRCTYCDSEYAFYEGRKMTVEEILTEVDGFGTRLVEITGGEPLLQNEVYSLMQAFIDKGYKVLLETGGAFMLGRVPAGVVKILDVKCPGSGESENNLFENFQILSDDDEIKFVLMDRVDYEWSKSLVEEYQLDKICGVLFSPVHDKLPLTDLAKWILADRLPVRLQTQLHKFIWGKDAIGV